MTSLLFFDCFKLLVLGFLLDGLLILSCLLPELISLDLESSFGGTLTYFGEGGEALVMLVIEVVSMTLKKDP